MDALCLSVAEAAQALGLGRSMTYQLVASGEIPSLKLGRRVVIPKAWIDKAVADAERKAS